MSTNTPESVIPEGDDANESSDPRRTGTTERDESDTSLPAWNVPGDHASDEDKSGERAAKKQRQRQGKGDDSK